MLAGDETTGYKLQSESDAYMGALFPTEVESGTQGSRPRSRTQKKPRPRTQKKPRPRTQKKPRPRTQKKPRPRPRTAFPRTEPLKAKDRNARGQGHRRKRSLPKKRSSKIFFQAISNSLAYPEFLIVGGPNHKSHEMTSSKFFQIGSFCGTKIS